MSYKILYITLRRLIARPGHVRPFVVARLATRGGRRAVAAADQRAHQRAAPPALPPARCDEAAVHRRQPAPAHAAVVAGGAGDAPRLTCSIRSVRVPAPAGSDIRGESHEPAQRLVQRLPAQPSRRQPVQPPCDARSWLRPGQRRSGAVRAYHRPGHPGPAAGSRAAGHAGFACRWPQPARSRGATGHARPQRG
ncbi:hypothetical protein G6F35_014909 [Rhizopus arrhizus]|nr:hypothetical protein G6F35_014909 [Rhizopus arrhizus]